MQFKNKINFIESVTQNWDIAVLFLFQKIYLNPQRVLKVKFKNIKLFKSFINLIKSIFYYEKCKLFTLKKTSLNK